MLENLIGVMQGRLVPKYLGRYQAHPKNYWKDEFKVANKLGLDCIEFILDFNEADQNPLLNPDGIDEIRLISEESGVQVKTICADYFMEAPLQSEDLKVALESQKVITKLINNASKLGVTDIVIPCVDKSSVNEKSISSFVTQLSKVLEVAENQKINLSLETDLPPKTFLDLLESFDSNRVTVNYDIGNSASLGFNPIDEINCYGHRISDIHIKDRELNGGPVILGQGNADFNIFFNKLKEFNYCGPFIMQAYRDKEGVNVFKEQLEWIKPYFQ
jgi:L-ribulose-5-phosphate 3-epimerase